MWGVIEGIILLPFLLGAMYLIYKIANKDKLKFWEFFDSGTKEGMKRFWIALIFFWIMLISGVMIIAEVIR